MTWDDDLSPGILEGADDIWHQLQTMHFLWGNFVFNRFENYSIHTFCYKFDPPQNGSHLMILDFMTCDVCKKTTWFKSKILKPILCTAAKKNPKHLPTSYQTRPLSEAMTWGINHGALKIYSLLTWDVPFMIPVTTMTSNDFLVEWSKVNLHFSLALRVGFHIPTNILTSGIGLWLFNKK